MTSKYWRKRPLTNDLQLATGLFSIGNAKLSDDTYY